MKKLIIFDLDGTLLDTSDGIVYSYQKAGEMLELKPNPVDNKKCVIGGPLKDGFRRLYEISSQEQVDNAIAQYRELYAKEGIKRFEVYQGIEQLLSKLKENGFYTAVATLKLEKFAVEMLTDAKLDKYFDIIKGWDGTDSCNKECILNRAIEKVGIEKSECMLVGDSEYDFIGAQKAGIAFTGVSYGFGFKNDTPQNIKVADSAYSLEKILLC